MECGVAVRRVEHLLQGNAEFWHRHPMLRTSLERGIYTYHTSGPGAALTHWRWAREYMTALPDQDGVVAKLKTLAAEYIL